MELELIFGALGLGFLTAISPCPLASNIAAVSFLGGQGGGRRRVVLAGLLYALGRTLVYVGLGWLLAYGFLDALSLSRFLQQVVAEILGPLLILLGLMVLGWLSFSFQVGVSGGFLQKWKSGGVWGALPLGMLFALSFCPVSAGLFLGGLLPLAIRHGSPVAAPLWYGLATAFPVVLFAFLMAFAARSLGAVFKVFSHLDTWLRRMTGGVFILMGLYLTLTHVYRLNF